jgi:hypothetical protein
MWGTGWGAKNYVESAAYLGVLVPLLAAIAFAHRRHRAQALFWLALGGLSLSFVFGLPTYRLLYFGLPGLDQLHTPFRWVYPLTLAVTVLAGLGLDGLVRSASGRRAARALGAGALALGALLAALVAGSWLAPERALVVTERLLAPAPEARAAVLDHFPDLTSFASYELWRFLHLALFLALSGVLLLAWSRPPAGR